MPADAPRWYREPAPASTPLTDAEVRVLALGGAVQRPGEVVVPMAVPLPNELHGRHYGAGKKAKQREQVGWNLVAAFGRSPPLPLAVRLVRVSPGWPDGDNAVMALKYARDSVAAWAGVDDGDEARLRFDYGPDMGREKAACAAVRIRVGPLVVAPPRRFDLFDGGGWR